ncbi:uncharacterized protein SPAPADRAFT_59702 [Spathaspora passalidarum NRRL Y-27907]|uniref:Uncharacterized protein n=1 Tax=Spathaspora passalidarum (strain NRRL Y-27907 / 11-Y1) TaxID=619300 RepID=G3AHX0_SPAPN|nr:uncharacterized protein SPAPADRAFT_59702 [Spathaspora passalidarum NRRL Y-27907]EGW34284.1 hypothetical protein SPAPADRAFT_59702 [Spathaspora passalidarum NRRL Y-27907]
MSNILSVFNPPPSRDLSDAELGKACLPCTAIQSFVAMAGGAYLNSPNQFKDKAGKIDFVKHPLWWQRSVRGAGIVLFGFGAYRAGEVIQILLEDRFE